jgi:serine/threonine-protein kinase
MHMFEVLDSTILRAISMQPDARFATAREMALEIERKCPPATASECGDWVENTARDVLTSRAAMVSEIESSASLLVEGREGHVQSVLNAKATLPPAQGDSGSGYGLPTPATAIGSLLAPLPPVTQPSSISVSTGAISRTHEAGGRRRTVMVVLIGVMMGASMLVAALVYRQSKAEAETPHEVVSVDPSAVPPTTDSSAPPIASPIPTPSVSAAPTPVAVTPVIDAGAHVKPSGPSTPTTSPAGGTKPPPVRTVTKPAPSPSVPSGNDDCSTPYWYDQAGVKHYKQQCLNR